MSRLVSLLIVLLAIAVATPVLADQRLNLSGEMRVRGYSVVAPGYNKDSSTSQQFYDQRFRLIGRIAVAEGVNVHFLDDISSGQWSGPTSAVRGGGGGARGWLNVNVGQVNVRAGKFFYSIANNIVLDTVNTGAVFTLRGEVPVEFAYFKLSEGQTTRDDDTDIYTLNVRHSTDMYSANVFGGYWRNGGASPDPTTKVYLVGAQSSFNLDPVNLNVELNYFHGDDGAPGAAKVDIRGIQFYLDAAMAIDDNITVGARGYYARGYDDKDQITTFHNNAANFQPDTYGSMNTEYDTFATGGANAIFDPSGQGAGSRAGQVYGTVKIMDPLTAHATAGYARPDKTRDLKSVYWGNVSGTYTLAARTNLDGVVSYAKPNFRASATPDDARIVAGMRLRVNF